MVVFWAAVGGLDPVWQGLLSVMILLGLAAFLGTVAEHLRQSAIVGYLIAGTLAGPHAWNLIPSPEVLRQVSELGVALLLFTIGLEFSLPELKRLGRAGLVAGFGQIIVTMGLTMAAVSFWLGWRAAVVVGSMVTMSSTACVLRLLVDRAEMESPHGRLSLAVLLLQDAAVIPLMLAVSLLARTGPWQTAVPKLLSALALGLVVIVLLYLLFQYVAPPLFALQARYRNRDLPILLAMTLALGAAVSAHAVGLSAAMGAFLAGVLLAVSPFAYQVRADVGPVKTVLVTLFFASVGMFGDPVWLIHNWPPVLAAALCIVVGKSLLVALICALAGVRLQFAVATGLTLAQVGEFSFVLATIAYHPAEGRALIDDTTFRTLLSATIVSLLLTPYLIAIAIPAGLWCERVWRLFRRRRLPVPAAGTAAEPSGGETEETTRPIVIVGFGPAGQRVAEELLAHGMNHIVVIDINPDNVAHARRYGLDGVLGDATQIEILEHAEVPQAAAVVLTVPMPQTARFLIQLIRHQAPSAMVIARSRYHIYRWALVQAGAHVVVDEEDEVGQVLARQLLAALQSPGD
ncbi:MAG: sodium/hydrogen exchanger [Pirellulaceae bacterium]|nr:MAG: sodium/hydrogen exchanger [Pirellulaceae bacterium]